MERDETSGGWWARGGWLGLKRMVGLPLAIGLYSVGAKPMRYDREHLLQLRTKKVCWIPLQELKTKDW